MFISLFLLYKNEVDVIKKNKNEYNAVSTNRGMIIYLHYESNRLIIRQINIFGNQLNQYFQWLNERPEMIVFNKSFA